MVSPLFSSFFVMTLGSRRRKLLPSTYTTSSSSATRSERGMRSASFGGRMLCQRPSGSRKCESPEWAQSSVTISAFFRARVNE